MKHEAPAGSRPGYLLPVTSSGAESRHREISSHSSASLDSRFSAKGDKELRSKIGISIALIFLGALLIIGRKTNIASSQTFESEPVVVTGFLGSENPDGELPERIILPNQNIDLSVREAKIVNGYWEVFEDGAAWGEDSGFPGQTGNQVIFAHAREGLFLPIKGAKVGEKVYVMTKDNWFAYEIREIKEVLPNQKEVIDPTLDETLTLYTCSGFNDSKRLILIAKRI